MKMRVVFLQLASILLLTCSIGIAQGQERVVTVFPGTEFINEIYYTRDGKKSGDYFSFYENQQRKSSLKDRKIDEDKIKGIKARGFYKNDLPDSAWTIYAPPLKGERKEYNEILEEGIYQSGKKIGVWYTFVEDGKVLKCFDVDQNKALDPIITPIYKYPPKAKANGIQGWVMIKIYYANCTVKKYEILKDIGYGCGRSVVETLKENRALQIKYGLLNNIDCSKKDEIVTTRFKL